MRRVVALFFSALFFMTCLSAFAAEWYEGGNLHDSGIPGWLIATDANQLATAADFVAGTTDPAQLRAQTPGTLKAAAQAVTDCITTFSDSGVFDRSMTVKAAAFICLKENQKRYPFLLSKADAAPNVATAPAAETITKEALQKEVRALLADLDSFRDTPIFKQCIYGCGKKNPGSAWDMRRKALQSMMTPQLDAPLLLKTAPGDLWALGMAYGKGRMSEAKALRAQIEAALKE